MNTLGRVSLTGFVAFSTDRYGSMAKPPGFLSVIFGEDIQMKEDRPNVTLTFAQSLDAKIAGVGGKQLILSGRESMVMTHW